MRSVSVVFRILLLPIFLVRFCLPRPPETTSRHLTNIGDELHRGNSHFQKYGNETQFTESVKDDNVETDFLNTDPAEFEKIRHNVRLLKLKRGNFVKRQSTFNVVLNGALSPNAKGFDSFIKNKHTTLFRTKTDLFGNLHGSQHTETPMQKHKQSVPLLQFKRTASNDAFVNTTDKAGTLKVERLHEIQIPSSPHSALKHRQSGIAGFRTKRAVKETFGSTRFEHTPSRTTPPEYMVHLFQLLSGTQYETLRNFVVTGFVNINQDEDSVVASGNVTARRQKLVFDVLISYETETIHYAEVRLYFVRLGHETMDKSGSETTDHQTQAYQIRISEKNEPFCLEHCLLAEKTVTNVHNAWVSFNLTSLVQNWTAPGLRTLEVATAFCGSCTNVDSKCNESCQDCSGNCINDLVVNLNNDQGKGPLLVIFSRKSETPMGVPHRREVRDTLKEKRHLHLLEENLPLGKKNDYKDSNASSGVHYFQGLVEFISATSNDLSTNLQHSEFALLTDSFSPDSAVYDQNDTEKDNNQILNNIDNSTFLNLKNNQPLTINISNKDQSSQGQHNSTSTEVRSIQKHLTLLKEHRVKTPSPENDTSKLSEDRFRMRIRRDTKVRYRRHVDGLLKRKADTSAGRQKRSKKKRVSCQRNEMYVDFETIKWDKVIIFPRGYQAFECVGKCYAPISEYLSPTKHAIIQTLVHTSYPDQASRACCVPTKLDPISILYWDDNGDIKYDYTYEGMVVADCGCR